VARSWPWNGNRETSGGRPCAPPTPTASSSWRRCASTTPTAPAGPAPPPAATARQAAARAALLRSLLWNGLLSVVLLVVWAMSGRDYFWPIWPILGFALFLGWQAFNLFAPQAPDQSRLRDHDR